MQNPRFARITREQHPDFPVGTIVQVAFYEHGYVVGHGLDQQIVGIKVRTAPEQFVSFPLRAFEWVSAGEAKAWRAEQKKARARARRGLDSE